MQQLLSVLHSEICSLDLTCNTKKSVQMSVSLMVMVNVQTGMMERKAITTKLSE